MRYGGRGEMEREDGEKGELVRGGEDERKGGGGMGKGGEVIIG